jgi:hypothetical protein
MSIADISFICWLSSELGKEGGKSGNQPDEIYKPKEHGGMKEWAASPSDRLYSKLCWLSSLLLAL